MLHGDTCPEVLEPLHGGTELTSFPSWPSVWARLTSELILILSSILSPWNLGPSPYPFLHLGLMYPPLPFDGTEMDASCWILAPGDQSVHFHFFNALTPVMLSL